MSAKEVYYCICKTCKDSDSSSFLVKNLHGNKRHFKSITHMKELEKYWLKISKE